MKSSSVLSFSVSANMREQRVEIIVSVHRVRTGYVAAYYYSCYQTHFRAGLYYLTALLKDLEII